MTDTQIQDLQQENSILRDLLQKRMPVGCIAETTYQPTLDENEKLKEKIEELEKEVSLINSEEMENEEKVAELKEENEKLKELAKHITSEGDIFKRMIDHAEKNDGFGRLSGVIWTEIKSLRGELAKYKEAESYLLVQSNPDAFIEKVRELKEELVKYKDLFEKVSRSDLRRYAFSVAQRGKIERLEEENAKLLKFTIGGGEASEVEKIITEKMTKEFIVENHEHWGEIGLFQEESEEAENKDLQKQVEELNKVVLRWQEKADFNLTDSDSSEEEDEELKQGLDTVSQ